MLGRGGGGDGGDGGGDGGGRYGYCSHFKFNSSLSRYTLYIGDCNVMQRKYTILNGKYGSNPVLATEFKDVYRSNYI